MPGGLLKYLGGRMKPCLPVSGSSTVKLYLIPAPPLAQSSLPPEKISAFLMLNYSKS
jgi:hypothetical protein